jgi:hypothetical protein
MTRMRTYRRANPPLPHRGAGRIYRFSALVANENGATVDFAHALGRFLRALTLYGAAFAAVCVASLVLDRCRALAVYSVVPLGIAALTVYANALVMRLEPPEGAQPGALEYGIVAVSALLVLGGIAAGIASLIAGVTCR